MDLIPSSSGAGRANLMLSDDSRADFGNDPLQLELGNKSSFLSDNQMMSLAAIDLDKRQWSFCEVLCKDIEWIKAVWNENIGDYFEWTGSTSSQVSYSRITRNRQD